MRSTGGRLGAVLTPTHTRGIVPASIRALEPPVMRPLAPMLTAGDPAPAADAADVEVMLPIAAAKPTGRDGSGLGIQNQKRDPRTPSVRFSSPMSPFISRTSWAAMGRPSPVPRSNRVRVVRAVPVVSWAYA